MKCAEGGGRSGPLRSRPLRHRRRRDECGRNLCESMVMGLLLRRATTAEVGEEEGMACFPRSHYNDNVVGGATACTAECLCLAAEEDTPTMKSR